MTIRAPHLCSTSVAKGNVPVTLGWHAWVTITVTALTWVVKAYLQHWEIPWVLAARGWSFAMHFRVQRDPALMVVKRYGKNYLGALGLLHQTAELGWE